MKLLIIKKHSFLLLELLVALFLLSTMLLPFAYLPIKALQKEYLSLQDLQVRRLADLQFSVIKKDLYSQEKIFLAVLSAKGPKEKVELSPPKSFILKLGSSSKKLIIKEYGYTHLREKNHYLIRILIEIYPENTKAKKRYFIYQLFIKTRNI
ncbi:MAG: hypothetical protein ACH349_05535 [Candidatus Rhabdochlamydia sp.]|jgi:hypothetical protein|nr:hypothetical protein [Chlamydiota bacterium]